MSHSILRSFHAVNLSFALVSPFSLCLSIECQIYFQFSQGHFYHFHQYWSGSDRLLKLGSDCCGSMAGSWNFRYFIWNRFHLVWYMELGQVWHCFRNLTRTAWRQASRKSWFKMYLQLYHMIERAYWVDSTESFPTLIYGPLTPIGKKLTYLTDWKHLPVCIWRCPCDALSARVSDPPILGLLPPLYALASKFFVLKHWSYGLKDSGRFRACHWCLWRY